MYEGWTALTWVLYIGAIFVVGVSVPFIAHYFMGSFTDHPPFRKGANWRGKKKDVEPWLSKSLHTTLAELERKDRVPTGAYRGDHNPRVSQWETTVRNMLKFDTTPLKVYTEQKDKGMYLTTNGDQHKCQLPTFKWTRGANLKNVWMCPCGKRYCLKAYRGKMVEDGTSFSIYRSWPRYKTVADTDKPLSLLDILKIGNEKPSPSKLWVSSSADVKIKSHEEVINDTVVFTWERITHKPKKEKDNG